MTPTDYAIKDILDIEDERIAGIEKAKAKAIAVERRRAAMKKKLAERRRCRTKYIHFAHPSVSYTHVTRVTKKQDTTELVNKIKKQTLMLWIISFLAFSGFYLVSTNKTIESKTIVTTDNFEKRPRLSIPQYEMLREDIIEKDVVRKKRKRKVAKEVKKVEKKESLVRLNDDPLGQLVL